MSGGGAIVGVVLAAAVLHATWNALVHRIRDQLVAFFLLGIGGGVACLIALPFVPGPAAASWPYLAGSVVLHYGYELLLMSSYRVGEFNQVYPLARGTAPWVVAVAAAVLLGETLGGAQLAGVLVIAAGLGSLVFAGGLPGRAQLPAIGFALGTGLAISSYTIVDGIGVRHSGSSLGYVVWLTLLESIAIPVYALVRHPARMRRQLRPYLLVGLLCGVLSPAAYGLVLYAQTRADLATVAALRETSVIAGAVIGAIFFHERFGRSRLLATLLVVAGIALLELG